MRVCVCGRVEVLECKGKASVRNYSGAGVWNKLIPWQRNVSFPDRPCPVGVGCPASKPCRNSFPQCVSASRGGVNLLQPPPLPPSAGAAVQPQALPISRLGKTPDPLLLELPPPRYQREGCYSEVLLCIAEALNLPYPQDLHYVGKVEKQ